MQKTKNKNKFRRGLVFTYAKCIISLEVDMPRTCHRMIRHVEHPKGVECGGSIAERVVLENGRHFLEEFCVKCRQNFSLDPMRMSDVQMVLPDLGDSRFFIQRIDQLPLFD